jgi:iron complex outermembrane receptor protein
MGGRNFRLTKFCNATQKGNTMTRVFGTHLGSDLRWFALASTGCIFLTAPAYGQDAQTATNSNNSHKNTEELQEVTVTAEKSATLLSKTPIAVSAITQEQLTNAGVRSLSDLTVATPNVQIEQFAFTGATYVAIRGIISKDWSETGDSDVGMYIDGVATPRSYGLDSAFYDLERVEVLRGPQGTLYGKDATAGNMNIITAAPEQQFAAETDYGYGNYGDVISHAMVNFPINDTLAIRGSVVFHRNNGYFDTEGTTTRNYGATDEYGGRISALWQPTDTFKWRFTIDDFISNNTEALAIATGADGRPIGGGSVYSRPVPSTPEPKQHITNFMARSRTDWQISSDLSLSYIFGFQAVDQNYATALPVSNALFATPGEMAAYGNSRNRNQYHEFNLSYESNRIKNLFGFNYTTERTESIYNNQLILDDFNEVIIEPDAADSSWGVFDQVTYNLTDNLHLTAGIRKSKDYKNVGSKAVAICPLDYFYGGGALPASCAQTPWNGTGSWSATTWKAGVDYDITDKIMSYVTVSTGYKAGGINAVAPSPEQNYRPEHNTNYEVGVKGRYLDGKATLNADFFYEDYKDIDVDYWVYNSSSGGTFLTENAARAAIWGPELDGSLLLTSADRIDGFLNYLHATYTDYQNAKDPLTSITYDLDGYSLPNAPRVSARLQYSHDFSLPAGARLTPMAAVYWQSVSYLREFNLADDKVPAYSKTSLRLTYTSSAGHWQVQGYVDNLEDNAVRVGVSNLIGAYNSWYAPPRTFGVTAKYQY